MLHNGRIPKGEVYFHVSWLTEKQLFILFIDLFICNTQHLLHDLLPPLREQHYSLRERSHNYCLPDHASTLMDKNFLIRMLFKDLGCSQSRSTLH